MPPTAVVKFARATGDIHALSTADVRLIALARGFEVAAHGDGRLHELPQLPKVQKKKVHDAKQVGTALPPEAPPPPPTPPTRHMHTHAWLAAPGMPSSGPAARLLVVSHLPHAAVAAPGGCAGGKETVVHGTAAAHAGPRCPGQLPCPDRTCPCTCSCLAGVWRAETGRRLTG